MSQVMAGFFFGVLAPAFVFWLTAQFAVANRRAEARRLMHVLQQARDFGDDDPGTTTCWFHDHQISRAEYYLLGGR